MEKLDQVKTVIDQLNNDVGSFMSDNSLSELPPFSKLQSKDRIGEIYRNDQCYYENIATFKAKYVGISSYLNKLKSEISDRALTRNIEELIEHITKKTDMLSITLSSAQSRIKFYQTVVYLISNMTYGDF
jgi:hypothetical protein